MRATLVLMMLQLLVAALAVAQPPDPGYLMPITAYRPLEASVQKLLGNRWGWGTMIYDTSPSDNDFAVSVWGADNKPKTLTLLRFSPKSEREAKAKSSVDVPIDSDFAEAIYKAWSALLLKTRYPPKIPIYADGWTAEFSAWIAGPGGVYGTGCPVGGFQKELMAFGFKLEDYCTAKPSERKAKRDAMIPRLQDFAVRVSQSHLY